jgi:uncharacterized membrane protein
MIWLTWRQHRGQALAVAVVFAAITIVFLATGWPMHRSFVDSGTAGCLAHPATSLDPSCDRLANQFGDRYQTAAQYVGLWLDLLPAIVGVLIGAPLLARELESGTWQLAWTQAVPRTRWLAVKLALLGTFLTVSALGFSVLYRWWHAPLDHIQGSGPLDASVFDFEGPSFTAYVLFAFAVGTVTGVLLRRTLPAMAATLAAFVVVRAPVEVWLRPHYQAPLTAIDATPARTDLVLDKGMVDAAGHHLSFAQQDGAANTAAATGTDIDAYLHSHGIRYWFSYQPVARAWHFQLIEAAIYLAATVILLGLALHRVRRRVL